MSEKRVFNILHVVTRLPVGGVENMLLKVVKGYDGRRFNVRVCCLKEGGEIADELEAAGYTVEILHRMKGHGFDWGAVSALYRLIKREDIHILRTHQYHANLYGRIAGTLARVPVMIPSFHNLYISPKSPKIHRRIINYLLGLTSDALVAVSTSVASDMIRYDRTRPGKIRVIHNGVALSEFNGAPSLQEARRALDLPLDTTIIGSAGRLTEQKGHRYLIEAVSGFRGCCLAIAGDGPLREGLQELARRSGVNCIFTGRLSPGTMPLFMRSLDIFCFPSLWEGFATTIIEAMAAGLPVVASDIPPHREVIGEAGILLPPRDGNELSKTLKGLIDTPPLRESLSRRAVERARLFSIEKTTKAYEELFEEILSRKGCL